MNKEDVEVSYRRRVVATMMKGQSKEVIMKRYYAYFDTAVPRMVQLALNYANEGDFVTFHSAEVGFEIGTLRVLPKNQFEIEMHAVVKSSPTLLKLVNEFKE
jgi:nitroimidazol reductase NimA-like FMN-containing flavoprotein (pyridoxamine 5'-phosphate oxidase superfamily)